MWYGKCGNYDLKAEEICMELEINKVKKFQGFSFLSLYILLYYYFLINHLLYCV